MGTAFQDKKNQTTALANDLKEKVESFASEGKLDDVVIKAKDMLDEGVQKASEFYDHSVVALEKNIKARPVAAMAIAFAAGIATVALTRSLMAKSARH